MKVHSVADCFSGLHSFLNFRADKCYEIEYADAISMCFCHDSPAVARRANNYIASSVRANIRHAMNGRLPPVMYLSELLLL